MPKASLSWRQRCRKRYYQWRHYGHQWKIRMNVKAGALLQISFVGYTTQEIKATPNLRVVLKDDTELLDEVVVVGYGSQKKRT